MGNMCAKPAKEEDAGGGGTKKLAIASDVDESEKIVFITDIEGNWDYFVAWVNITEGVSLDDDHGLTLDKGVTFVFGGDVGDKGPGSLRVFAVLVKAHLTYNEAGAEPRVVLLLGNRDLNKMRLTSELADHELTFERMLVCKAPYWVAKGGVSPKMYLAKEWKAAWAKAHPTPGSAGGDDVQAGEEVPEPEDEDLRALNTRTNRLKWILKDTQGSDGDFERRREELAFLTSTPQDDISDEKVTESFLESVAEGGCIRQYLELGKLVWIKGDTLFVHGGVIGTFPGVDPAVYGDPAESICVVGVVPGTEGKIADVRAWELALNAWKEEQVAEWIAMPRWERGSEEVPRMRGGWDAVDYVVGTCQTPSVVMGRHLSKAGMPQMLKDADAEALVKAGIQRIFVGHTPHGNCPTVIRQLKHPLVTYLCDTSYSAFGQAKDNRGSAVSNIVITKEGTRVHGVDQKANGIDYTIAVDEGEGGMTPVGGRHGEEAVGVMTTVIEEDPRGFIKAKFDDCRCREGEEDATDYLMCHVAGYVTTYTNVKESEVREALDLAQPTKPNSYASRERMHRTMSVTFGIDDDNNDSGAKFKDSLELFFVDGDVDNDQLMTESEFTAQFKLSANCVKKNILDHTGATTATEAFKALNPGKSGALTKAQLMTVETPRAAHTAEP